MLQLAASFHVSTAIVKLKTVWVNTSGKKVCRLVPAIATHEQQQSEPHIGSYPNQIDALFAFPVRGTVTASRIRIGGGRIMETQVIGMDEAAKCKTDDDAKTKLNIPSADVDTYVPDLFRLPVAGNLPFLHVCVM